MKQGIGLLFYNVLLAIFALLDITKWCWYLLRLAIAGLFGKSLDSHEKREWQWGQKYGLLPWAVPHKALKNNCVMIHCASVGEVVATWPMAAEILKRQPDINLVFTTNTRTGKQQIERMAKDLFGTQVYHQYLPIDLPWIMAKLLRQLRPEVLIIMEVELWPNLIKQAKRFDIPVSIINARLTDKTAKGYRKFSWVTGPMIRSLSQVFVRNHIDYRNYLSFDFAENKLTQLGNIKFDIELPNKDDALQMRDEMGLSNRIVFLAGSTHAGEEELVVRMYKAFKTKHPELALLIAPRHPQRFNEVLEYLLVQDLKVNQQSKPETFAPFTDVLLIDEMGLLSRMYGVADITFVGGSVANRGGHNPIEPASYAKPVLMGPNIQNNPEICDVLVNSGGLKIVADESEFSSQFDTWISDLNTARQAGDGGFQTIVDHQGLIDKVVDKVFEGLNAQREKRI